ncbi:aryl-alcohol dehydrogenase-related enzyme [Lacticaseibacillus paracasei]|nr:aryl-alcohol dehydrogenase-related enzyme [Lacticaseibacillus paracasei]
MAMTTTIGKSTVTTGKLGLGTNKVGGHNLFPNLHDEDGIAVVKAALDHGIDMLDTAYMYGLGQSEKLIGEATQGYDRSKIILATKAAQDPHNDLKPNNDPKFLTQAIDDALLRLKTDYLEFSIFIFLMTKLTKRRRSMPLPMPARPARFGRSAFLTSH